MAESTSAPVEVSKDERYLRHEFRAPDDALHFTAGWTPRSVEVAVSEHLSGRFYLSSKLAIDCIRYPPIMGALRQRMAPAQRAKWSVDGSDRAPGRFAREDVESAWAQVREIYGDLLRALDLLGVAWLHMHLTVNADGIEVPMIKQWPMSAVTYLGESYSTRAGYYATTTDAGGVPMTHGDGKWIKIGDGATPHLLGAIAALGLTYPIGQQARRDRAGLSKGAGRASPVASMPSGVTTTGPEGDALDKVVATIGLGRDGAVLPAGVELKPFSVNSDTSFFKDSLADELLFVALALLGQSGTLAAGSGGVYSAPVYRGVAAALVDADLGATICGFNTGIAMPLTRRNYPLSVAVPQLVGAPPEEREATAAALAGRMVQLHDIISKEKANGFDVMQDRVNALADELQVPAPVLMAAAPGGGQKSSPTTSTAASSPGTSNAP